MTKNDLLTAKREEWIQRHLDEQRTVYQRAGFPFERQHELLAEMGFTAGVQFATWWLSEGCKESGNGTA